MEIATLSVITILSQWVWPILLFIFGLGTVVFVHELGHFLVAKAVGIKVERFAIGFGPRVCGYRGKETDYSLMLLPLGGYVKMLGQEDFEKLKEDEGEPDPRAYSSKSVGARFAVISAGVIMNVIFAAVLFVIVGMIGIQFPAPVVGSTDPGFPSDTEKITWLDDSGKPMDASHPQYPKDQAETLQPGDEMKTIDGPGVMLRVLGRDITRFRRVSVQGWLSDETDKYTLGIERTVGDKVLTGRVTLGLKMGRSPSGSGGMLPSFGLNRASSTILSRGAGLVPNDGEIFKNKDRIVAVNGQKTDHNWDIDKVQKTLLGHPVQITVERTVDGKTTRVDLPSVRPMVINTDVFYLKGGDILRAKVAGFDNKKKILTLQMTEDGVQVERKVSVDSLANTHYDPRSGWAKEFLDVLGMIPRLRIGAVSDGSPAHDAGLQAGDIIVRYGGYTAPTHLKLKELNKKFATDGADIVVVRDGKQLPPLKIKPEAKRGNFLLGFIVNIDMENLVVAGVRENSPAADREIVTGDVIEKVNEQDVTTWPELLTALSKLKGKDATLTVRRGSNLSEKTFSLTAAPIAKKKAFDTTVPSPFEESDYTTRILTGPWNYQILVNPKVSRGPVAALAWGGRETMFFVTTSYATLRSLINRTVSTKDIAGPVGIGRLAIQAGRKSMLDFAYFMAMISVSLAVINFLPFPVVDGGHALFLIIEKIRGKPLSIRVMNVVQLVGLATILLVFVLVTWQDVSRLLGG
ncbi:MAG: site-2 protease family protein [Phycisphaerae bacterium]|jgi:membrane-associated protease RseP (regulator of RpoE activity)|nr:site-2 protease family protein [Phycisphaerae bacterium]